MIRHRQVLLLLVVVGLGVAGCTDARRITSPEASRTGEAARRDLWTQVLDLLPCRPAAYDSVVRTVGTSGGTIHAGANTLTIPPGALDSNTTITAVVPSDPFALIRFQPQGLTFARPARLTMSYAACPLAGLLTRLRVVYTNDAHSILEVEPSFLNPLAQTVTGRIGHFSGYAVAY